ncbi:muscle M-line assembly protein unc-89 [Acanthopagrus latus]|uniref:muscle M-line assembly protein unc-89 n=1 Tax=Acanthopagrus latus TaxID=8177 RepID=UPI00187C2E4B|nr:muscle M-line assembly protein unc-89 [Acanthopagrus latus]
MEENYPTLRRPKRKLCYMPNKKSTSNQWVGKLELEDIDKMFDDLEPSSLEEDDPVPQSLLLQISETGTDANQTGRDSPSDPEKEGQLTEKVPVCHMEPKGDLHPTTGAPSPKLDIDLDIPFEVHGPRKTSSPIEEKVIVDGEVEMDNEKDTVMSPVLFVYEDQRKEEAETEFLPTQKQQGNGLVAEQLDDFELESPPSSIALSKPIPSQQNKGEESCKESQPAKEKASKKPHTADLKGKRKAQRQEILDPPMSAVRDEPEVLVPEKKTESARKQPFVGAPARVGHDMTTFLQKLREATKPKPSCSRKSLSPIKAPPPPEPEDNFLILEDDSPLWFSIPSKSATSKRPNKTSSNSKDGSDEKGAKDSPIETEQKQQEAEQARSKLGSQTVNQKIKKMKVKEKKNEVTEPGNDMDELCSPEDPPADDLMTQEKPNKNKRHKKASAKERDQAAEQPELCSPEEPPAIDLITQEKPNKNKRHKKASAKDGDQAAEQPELCSPEEPPANDLMTQEKPDKKKRLKKASSKESDQAEEQPKDTAMDEEKKPTLEKKAQNSSDMKRSKSLKEGNENAKTSRAKSLKGDKKVPQESGAVIEMVRVEAEEEQSQEPVDALPEKEIMNSETQSGEKNKQNRPLAVSEESSSEDIQIPGKRKRRQPGQWWVSGSPSTEETKVSDSETTLKKSRQSKKEPIATVLSPVKTKKDGGMKRRNQPAPSLRQKTNKAKEKKTSQNRNRKTKGDTPAKVKASEVFDMVEAEQIEEQEVADEDMESSPLVFAHREHSQNRGDQVFQRVYHHVPNEKASASPAPVSPRGQREQLRSVEPGKRRRRPTGNWWIVNGLSEDVDSVSLPPQQQGPKPRKDRKKQAKQSRSPGLGTPINGNMVVSPKPQGGAPVPRLKVKPLSSPKTVKRSLAMFNDISTSVTPTIVSSKETGQRKKCKVTAHPAVEVTVTDYTTLGKKHEDIVSMDAGESISPLNQDDHYQSENTLKALRSGPSSMIELEQFEENDDMILPSNRSEAVLSASDLCAPPLKPLILQPKDKANLIEWFKSLWSTTIENGPEISPDHFDWYFYQGRAMGLMVDVNGGSFCSGKILLGSYMKKPLWVDHSATTVFNLLTSSVSVTVNSRESRSSPGQSFMVQCGHAYSIQNITAQPAVLYFTRILAESSD